jgi:hypothetical protein
MNKKIYLALASAMILITLLSPLTAILPVKATDPTSYYTTENGVLHSDYYVLYPFEKNSVNFGFSKFGELMGIPTGSDPNVQASWVGMEYGGRDPFTPIDTVPMTSWINGWYIDIEYIDPVLSGALKDRHLFAFAMFADGFAWGGDWQTVTVPTGAPHGGRKTNGYAVTDDLLILEDSARRTVFYSVTHLYDKEGDTTWPVVNIMITGIFNKVSKEIILLKDVKITIPKMHIYGRLDVQFSNREEYDLGPSPSYDSYAHYYAREGEACYTSDWTLVDDLLRDRVETQKGGSTVYQLSMTPIAPDFIKVFINDVFQDPSLTPTPYTVDWSTGQVTFNVAPASTAIIKFLYKYVIISGSGKWNHEYDIAQVVSSDRKFVAWTGLWPDCSDYTVDGILRFLDPLYEVNEADMSTEPKQSPLIIGEWDFVLDHSTYPQFRGVEVKGIANLHNADDKDRSGGSNIKDIEALYQLDMVYLPWDLNDAIDKDYSRWVQFYTVGALDVGKDLIINLKKSDGVTINKPVVYAKPWEEYNCNSERVIWNDALKYPTRAISPPTKDYELFVNDDGTAYITISAAKVPAAGTRIKILYSTYATWSDSEWTLDLADEEWTTTMTQFPDTTSATITRSYTFTADGLNVVHSFDFAVDIEVTVKNNVTFTESSEISLDGVLYDFKVLLGDPYENIYYFWNDIIAEGTNIDTVSPTRDPTNLEWDINTSVNDVDIDYLDIRLYLVTDVSFNATTGQLNVTVSPEMGYSYNEHMMGRYEWFTVGRDALSSDSLGVGFVTAGLEDKQVEIGNAGVDMMYASEYGNVSIPYVLRGFGVLPGYPPAYKDSILRIALQDDWCTKWPVASSNMIAEGGPLANHLTEYFNDFTDAFFGLNTVEAPFTPYAPWVSKIIALPCWSKDTYASSASTGYAVIAAGHDINETSCLTVWGINARDTFYASQWFHDKLARGFQVFPDCATSVVIKIGYTDPLHPTFSIVEVLGTISETSVSGYDAKLHPDP